MAVPKNNTSLVGSHLEVYYENSCPNINPQNNPELKTKQHKTSPTWLVWKMYVKYKFK